MARNGRGAGQGGNARNKALAWGSTTGTADRENPNLALGKPKSRLPFREQPSPFPTRKGRRSPQGEKQSML